MARIEPFRGRTKQRAPLDLAPVVAALRYSREVSHNIRHQGRVRELPSATVIWSVLEELSVALFPTHLGPEGLEPDQIDLFVSNTLTTALSRLTGQIARGLQFTADALAPSAAQRLAAEITHRVTSELPRLRAILVDDLKAARRLDAAAESLGEILVTDRGLTAILNHRFAHALHRHGARLTARLAARLATDASGIDLHPGARIGSGFAIMGGGVIVGDGVVIEDGVTLHAGATLRGPITIGKASVIGEGLRITADVPPGSVLTPPPAKPSRARAVR